jgi:hypothetical protein
MKYRIWVCIEEHENNGQENKCFGPVSDNLVPWGSIGDFDFKTALYYAELLHHMAPLGGPLAMGC